MTEEKLKEFLGRYLDGLLTNAESKQLLEVFDSSPDTKSWFMKEVTTSNLIYALKPVGDFPDVVLESIQSNLDVSDLNLESVRLLKPVSSKRSIRLRVGLVACAAVLVFGGLFLMKPATPVATLVQATKVVWKAETQFAEGDQLLPGVLKLDSGLATLKFGDAVRVTLEGPTEFELISREQARLHQGEVSAHVSPAGVGFQIKTEQADVIDLGTVFSVSVDENQKTGVKVFEGEVDVSSTNSASRKIITEGQNLRFSGNSRVMETFAMLSKPASNSWKQLFGVHETQGRVRFLDEGPMTNLTKIRDSENILVIPERIGKAMDKAIEVTITEPGIYDRKDTMGRTEILKRRDERLDVFLIQFNPVRDLKASQQKHDWFVGDVSFNRKILGIIANQKQLKATDFEYGRTEFDYMDGVKSRGLEFGDRLILSKDRKRLRLKWSVESTSVLRIDQVRVLVESD